MPLVLYDRVRETTNVTGNNDAVLLGAVTGFQSFAVVGNGNTCYYTIADQSGGNWEVGLGTYSTTGPTLQRTTVLSSSNAGNKVLFGAGVKDVFLTYPSEKAVYLDGSDNVQPNLGELKATQVNITAQGDLRLEDSTGGEYVGLQAPATLASSYTLTLPVDDGTNGQALVTDGNGVLSWSSAASGDVYGPASATDNAIARFDGTTGKIIKNSVVTIADTTGNMTGVGTLSSGAITSSSLTSGRVLYAGTSGLIQDSANLTFNGTTLTANDFADSSLTAGRVTYAGAGGNLTDSANLTFNGTTLTVNDLTDSSLTAGRVTYAGASGNLTDSANLTFNGTTLVANDITDSSLTSGRVTFAGASGNLTDSANLTWNGSTLGITGALTASADSSFTSTGALLISKGTTLQQPGSPATGMMRYNTTTNQFEGYSGSSPAWKSIGGSALSNDTSTASNLYPVFASATTGTAENLFTSNAKLLYKPSTGELQASEMVASNGVFINNQTMSASYSMPAGYSGMSTGPFTVGSGVTFTIPSGSRHVVL